MISTQFQADRVVEHIIEWLKLYAAQSGQNGWVIGVSGGIDSAVTSALCARTGLPTLAQGVGVNNTNAVHLILNWEYGNNTNLSLTNLNQAARSLSAVSSIQSSIYLETASESSAVTNPTLVKLAI